MPASGQARPGQSRTEREKEGEGNEREGENKFWVRKIREQERAQTTHNTKNFADLVDKRYNPWESAFLGVS